MIIIIIIIIIIEKKLVEYEGVNENEVLKIMDKVNLAKRVANMVIKNIYIFFKIYGCTLFINILLIYIYI